MDALSPPQQLPTPPQLRYFLALSEIGHFSRAAAACGVSQATLSLGIQALERTLGAPLMDRSSYKNAVLTPLGREVISHGRAALAALISMMEAASVVHAPMSGKLRLGIIPTIAPYLLPRLGRLLRDNFPDMRLFLRQDATRTLIDWLAANRLDALLVGLPADCGGAASTELMREELLLAVPFGHRLSAIAEVTPAMLEGERVLLLEPGHCLRDQAIACCGLMLRESDVAGLDGSAERRDSLDGFAASDLASLVQMVAGGEGVAVLPHCAIAAGLLTGTGIVACKLAGASRGIGLVWRQGSPLGEQFAAHAGPYVVEALEDVPTHTMEPSVSAFDDRSAVYVPGAGR